MTAQIGPTTVSVRRRALNGAAAAILCAEGAGLLVPSTALAACTAAPTAGNDTIVCDTANAPAAGLFDLLAGNDTLTVNGTPLFSNGGTASASGVYSVVAVQGGTGNDTLNINGGIFNGQVQGGDGDDRLTITAGTINATVNTGNDNDTLIIRDGLIRNSVNLGAGNDRVFLYGGTVMGEFQNGAGTDWSFLFGGTVQGTVEMQRGAVNSVIVVDGARLLAGFEMQAANSTVAAAVNPTFYLRSGFVGVGGWGNVNDSTFIIDAINSKNPSSIDPFAADISAAFAGMTANTNASHLLVIAAGEGGDDDDDDAGGEGVGFGAGADTLRFVGAVNFGSGVHNLRLGSGELDDIPAFDGDAPTGTQGIDVLTVEQGSRLALGGVDRFEQLTVSGASDLTLAAGSYDFSATGQVSLTGGSTLSLINPETSLRTNLLQLASGTTLRVGAIAVADDDDDDAAPAAPVETIVRLGAAGFVNAGTLSLANGIAGDNLTIVGAYQATNATLELDAALGIDGPATDSVEIQGAVTGSTTLVVRNVSRSGAATEGEGLLIVSAPLGGLTSTSFQLAEDDRTERREVRAGAYTYRAVTSSNAVRLQSDFSEQTPAYAVAALIVGRDAYIGFNSVYKRLGEVRTEQDDKTGAWGRLVASSHEITPKKGSTFVTERTGFMAGFDFGKAAGEGRRIGGVFIGAAQTDATVRSTIFNAASASDVSMTSFAAGAYGTYYAGKEPGVGLYTDVVGKFESFDMDLSVTGIAARASTKAQAVSGSGEVGYGYALSGNLTLQPQGQVVFTQTSVRSFVDNYGLVVGTQQSRSLIGRLGVQLQSNQDLAPGRVLAIYGSANVLGEFYGKNDALVSGSGLSTDAGGTWFNLMAGASADLEGGLKLYGSAQYDAGDQEGWQASAGVRYRF